MKSGLSAAIVSCWLVGGSAFSASRKTARAPIWVAGQRGWRLSHSFSDHNDASNRSASPESILKSRRQALVTLLSTVAALQQSSAADAYNREFPSELDTTNGYLDGRQRMVDRIREREFQRTSPLAIGVFAAPLSSLLWGSALWFLSGSRSNPLVTPLANLLYQDKPEWLKDRNEGLFADVPATVYVALLVVFVCLGFAADRAVTLLAEGERNISLQLAGVSLISGAALEIGRIASGEKKQTRAESDRDTQLEEEFEEFATQRLKKGGSCHRSEVVKAFRRFYGKYRTDNEQFPLSDLEIEQLVRAWCRVRGIEMSSAGFFKGLQINVDADVVVGRL